MNTEINRNIDDVGEAIREGRGLRPAHAYRIQFAQDNLNFHAIEVSDPVPLGRQILVAAGLNVHEDYSLFAILETGDFEGVGGGTPISPAHQRHRGEELRAQRATCAA